MSRHRTYMAFYDSQGKPVRLSLARWRHIKKRHPEIAEDDIRQALNDPACIERNRESRLYLRPGKGGVVTVAVKDARGLYIRTAYVAPAMGGLSSRKSRL